MARTVTSTQRKIQKEAQRLIDDLYKVKEDTLPVPTSSIETSEVSEVIMGEVVLGLPEAYIEVSGKGFVASRDFPWINLQQRRLIQKTVVGTVAFVWGGLMAIMPQSSLVPQMVRVVDGNGSPRFVKMVDQSLGNLGNPQGTSVGIPVAEAAEIGTINPIESVTNSQQGQEATSQSQSAKSSNQSSVKSDTGAKTGNNSESIAEESVGQGEQAAEEVQLAQQEAVATETGATGGAETPVAVGIPAEKPSQISTPTETPTEPPPSNPTTPPEKVEIITSPDQGDGDFVPGNYDPSDPNQNPNLDRNHPDGEAPNGQQGLGEDNTVGGFGTP